MEKTIIPVRPRALRAVGAKNQPQVTQTNLANTKPNEYRPVADQWPLKEPDQFNMGPADPEGPRELLLSPSLSGAGLDCSLLGATLRLARLRLGAGAAVRPRFRDCWERSKGSIAGWGKTDWPSKRDCATSKASARAECLGTNAPARPSLIQPFFWVSETCRLSRSSYNYD